MPQPYSTSETITLLGRTYPNKKLLIHDVSLISIMMILAACGIIYEFMLSHYAARVLGAAEVAIFGVFTVMIASMGIGALGARYIKCPFTGFAWLELAIGIIGSSAILFIAACIAVTQLLPYILEQTYHIQGIQASGGIIKFLQSLALYSPYLIAFILGALVGAEIPLIAKVRELVHKEQMQHNLGTIYGADYIGAGLGALLFVLVLLTLDITTTAVIVATTNLLAGLYFYSLYKRHIRYSPLLLSLHILAICLVIVIARFGNQWEVNLEDMLYKDKVIHSMTTQYQRVVITERIMDPKLAANYSLHINGHTQFSSHDEHIYHSMLTYPALAASARHDNILIIGGGDGLALRDVLRWNPKQVTLIDLDQQIINFFTHPLLRDGKIINQPLLKLNEFSFSDKRVKVIVGDAFLKVDELLQASHRFDSIIIDLPDPNHPDLNKLYSSRFYAKLLPLLSGDGAISVQSTSPYFAKEAFLSIAKTMQHAGFTHVQQYHHNVPSFGEWGWTIATPRGTAPTTRIKRLANMPVDDAWTTKRLILAAFEFDKHFFQASDGIKINRLGSNVLYNYHRLGWNRATDL